MAKYESHELLSKNQSCFNDIAQIRIEAKPKAEKEKGRTRLAEKFGKAEARSHC